MADQPESNGDDPVSPVTARMHALLARDLIAACGGLDEAARACRLHKSRLSEFQDPNRPTTSHPAFMPADVICDLEAYCGRPIYSAAMAKARPTHADVGHLVDEVADVTEHAAHLQQLVRALRAEKRPLTPREKLIIDAAILRLHGELDEAQAAIEMDDEGAP